MREMRTVPLIVGVLASAFVIFVLDAFYLPLGVAIWLPYVGVVLVSLWLPHRYHVFGTAALCSILTVVGLFLSPPGASFWLSGANRFLALIAFWIAAVAGVAARRSKELETAYKALQQAVQRREELEAQLLRTQRLESIGVLTAGISHDFNNLLTPILMATKLLQEERPKQEQRQLLQTLRAGAERAADLVRKLLAFAGGMGGERRFVQVSDLVMEIKEIVERTFPKTIRVQTQTARDLPPVLGDVTQLSQVLMNLCVNARDAMPAGGTLSIVAEKAVLDDGYAQSQPNAREGVFVRVTVADTGCGMSAEVLDKAFDPFFTTKPQGKGTGLGLSTALGIIRSHGGFLDVDSRPGGGSRFVIYLPSPPAESIALKTMESTAIRGGDGKLVLVVDDESLTLQTVKAVLEGHGYRILTAHDGAAALEVYNRNQGEVQTVLLDMMLPDMDGLAVLGRLRETDPRVRVIATSGVPVTDRGAEILMASQVTFLPKPYTDEQLLEILGNVTRSP